MWCVLLLLRLLLLLLLPTATIPVGSTMLRSQMLTIKSWWGNWDIFTRGILLFSIQFSGWNILEIYELQQGTIFDAPRVNEPYHFNYTKHFNKSELDDMHVITLTWVLDDSFDRLRMIVSEWSSKICLTMNIWRLKTHHWLTFKINNQHLLNTYWTLIKVEAEKWSESDGKSNSGTGSSNRTIQSMNEREIFNQCELKKYNILMIDASVIRRSSMVESGMYEKRNKK